MELQWRKSTFSPASTCVELADAGAGLVAVRNSNKPDEGTLRLSRSVLAGLLADVKAGDLDNLT
jgi:hypothetical protein